MSYKALTYIAYSGKRSADALHRVGSEGDVGEVSGERVPPGGERGLSQSVPEDSHALSLSPKHIETKNNTYDDLARACDTTSDIRVNAVIGSVRRLLSANKSLFCSHLGIMYKALNINTLFASGHIQNSYIL